MVAELNLLFSVALALGFPLSNRHWLPAEYRFAIHNLCRHLNLLQIRQPLYHNHRTLGVPSAANSTNSNLTGSPMVKPNYAFEKRQRELAKKKKKEDKRLRKQPTETFDPP